MGEVATKKALIILLKCESFRIAAATAGFVVALKLLTGCSQPMAIGLPTPVTSSHGAESTSLPETDVPAPRVKASLSGQWGFSCQEARELRHGNVRG
jgi:hypothetical protein